MKKIEDIKTSSHRSIKDIELSRRSISSNHQNPSRKSRDEERIKLHIDRSGDTENVPIDSTHNSHKVPRKSRRWRKFFIALSLIIVLTSSTAIYVGSVYFSRARFIIIPKIIDVSTDNNFNAYHSSSGNEGIEYMIHTAKSQESIVVESGEGKLINEYARGRVTLYNKYTTSTQRLVAGTRLSPLGDSRIYKLESSVVIPGYKKVNGSITPGQVVASIVADKPGVEYDITNSTDVRDMKVVAYKGSGRYEDIYARVTSPIEGGFSGREVVIEDNVLSSSTAALKFRTRSEAIASALVTTPTDFIIFDSLCNVSFSKPESSRQSASSSIMTMSAIANCVSLNTKTLSEIVAGPERVAQVRDADIITDGLNTLDVSIGNLASIQENTKIPLNIKVSGTFSIIGKIPVEEVRSRLVGQPLSMTEALLGDINSAIDSVHGEVIPPWSQVPNDIKRISVVVKTP